MAAASARTTSSASLVGMLSEDEPRCMAARAETGVPVLVERVLVGVPAAPAAEAFWAADEAEETEPRAWRAADGEGDDDAALESLILVLTGGFLVAVDMAAKRCGEP